MATATDRVAHLIERGHVDPVAIARLMVARDKECGARLGSAEALARLAEYEGVARTMLDR